MLGGRQTRSSTSVIAATSSSGGIDQTTGGGGGGYNDSHRLFLQAMLSHRLLAEDKALEIYHRVCDLTQAPRLDFADFVAVINGEIGEVDLALRRTRDERDGHPVIALVNTKEDEIAQVATNYTANEITYFRQVLEMIIMADDENYAVSTMAALRLGQKMKPAISQRETQELLDRLVDDGWLCMSPDGGSYVMDNRATMELQGYLREQYGDVIKECLVCYEVITMGERCELQACPVRIHRHCADGYFRDRQQSVIACPQCSTTWSRHNTFGLGLPL